MPPLPQKAMESAILAAFRDCGTNPILLQSPRSNPRRFAVHLLGGPLEMWIYAWTLTPGGRPQLANEYRIQMTSVFSPLEINPEGPTLLIGYEPTLGVFGGFDLARHRTFTTGSPSVQIDLQSLREALQAGLAFDIKTNSEITVAFRPDQLVMYAQNAARLHRAGRAPELFRSLRRAAALEPIAGEDLASLSGERQRLVRTVSIAARAANFSDQVLAAYAGRCAVTRMQMRLVDAAHILPVAVSGSYDAVTNGIALSPTYHRAYDRGLVYLDEEYIMRLNPHRVRELDAQSLTGGVDLLAAPLGRIHLPPDRRQWPDRRLIRRANTHRGIIV